MNTTPQNNLINDLNSLNASLPPGIRAVFVAGRLHYVVRTSKRGKKQSLGTFLDLEVAKAALVRFKLSGTVTLSAEEQQTIADKAAAELARQQAKKRLDLVPMKPALPSSFGSVASRGSETTIDKPNEDVQEQLETAQQQAQELSPSDDRLFVLLCAECDDRGPQILFDDVVSRTAENGVITVFPKHIVNLATQHYFGYMPTADDEL